MKTKNTPAFPVEVSIDDKGNLRGSQTSNFSGYEMGLTKREYFAAKALQGLISNPNYFSCDKNMILEKEISKRAFSLADDMIKQSKND